MTDRYPTIAMLPNTDASLILQCNLAYHAAAPAREVAERDREARQRSVDAVLPQFLAADPLDRTQWGSRWTNLADLALTWDQGRGVGYVFDLSSPGATGSEPPDRVLPRGSLLRLLEPYWETWGYGYLAGIFYDLAVGSGFLAGRTVTVGDYARISWAYGVSRQTLAAALIVPADSPDASEPGAAVRRYVQAVAALRDVGVPVTRPDRMPVEPLERAGDLEALGAPEPGRG